MALKHIRLELARCKEYPEGSAEHGYELYAPLTPEGHLDAGRWRDHRETCTVRRFWGHEGDEIGHLVHKSGGPTGVWAFHYDGTEPEDDEPLFKLDSHRFAVGEYLSIRESDGESRTFVVAVVR